MIFTLIKIIFPTAILVFFSQEFRRMTEKLFAIRGVKLFLPLVAMTLAFIHYEQLITTVLLWLNWILVTIANGLAKILPLATQKVASNLILILTAVFLSIAIVEARKKRRLFIVYRNDWVVHLIVWCLLAIELSVC